MFKGTYIGRVYMFKGPLYGRSLDVLKRNYIGRVTCLKGHYIGHVYMFNRALYRTSVHVQRGAI